MTENVSIQTDHRILAATYTSGGTQPGPAVILVHGWRSNRNGERNKQLAMALAKHGISSLAIDLAGHGESSGDIAQATTLTAACDIMDAANYLLYNGPRRHTALAVVGASIGASASLRAMSIGGGVDTFRCGVLICPRTDFRGIDEDMYCFTDGDRRIENRKMLPDGLMADFYQIAGYIDKPVLVIHGTNDEFIPLEQSRKLVSTNPSHFQLFEIEGGDHRMQTRLDEIVKATVEFLIEHLK